MTHALRTRKALPYLFSFLSPCRIVVAFAYLLALHDEKSFVLSHPLLCMYVSDLKEVKKLVQFNPPKPLKELC